VTDEIDYEREFYGIMAQDEDDVKKIALAIKKDTFDASEGLQIGVDARGNVAMMIVASPGTTKMMVDAWEDYHDHECEPAHTALMTFMQQCVGLMAMIQPALGEEVAQRKFFEHGSSD
jgi:hypothetical protein